MSMAGPCEIRTDANLDRAGYIVLDHEACRELLSTGGLGRVAINVGALPVILPVHFWLDDDHVVFCVCRGTSLDRATRDAVVAFQTDGHDADGAPWSVSFTGMAERRPLDELDPGIATGWPAWPTEQPVETVSISTEYATGRRCPGR
jgi:nitroimidazol reductase NimA-like FMN-containing flavoprotein (pyridoxamine 5'-phosphate oxidase superfamily)